MAWELSVGLGVWRGSRGWNWERVANTKGVGGVIDTLHRHLWGLMWSRNLKVHTHTDQTIIDCSTSWIHIFFYKKSSFYFAIEPKGAALLYFFRLSLLLEAQNFNYSFTKLKKSSCNLLEMIHLCWIFSLFNIFLLFNDIYWYFQNVLFARTKQLWDWVLIYVS